MHSWRCCVFLALCTGVCAPWLGGAVDDLLRVTPSDTDDWRKVIATQDLVRGFNGIGQQAGNLRRAMSRDDAEAFDAVMLDLMSAMAAIPSIGILNSGDPNRVRPRAPRFDRIPQIRPDLLGLANFFARLQRSSEDSAESRMFAEARKHVRRMLSALPAALPTVAHTHD